MAKMYTNADTAPMLSALTAKSANISPHRKEEEENSNGRLGFERSLPEKPARINAFLRAGMRRTVKMNAPREKPTEACRGWPSLLKMRAPETARPASVDAEMRIGFADDMGATCPL